MQILIAILTLGFLIMVHEFGHFIVAKLSGIKVLEFWIFMGPKLFSFKRGETTYSLRLIPIGGLVRMEGEEAASDDERAFNKKPIWVRAAVIAAGPLMNLIIAVILIAIIVSWAGFTTNKISKINPESPAYQQGIREGDQLLDYNNKKLYTPLRDIEILALGTKENDVDLVIKRGNETITKTVTPQRDYFMLGFRPKVDTGPNSTVAIEVTKNLPAEKAGLKVNDKIIALNGTPVADKKAISDYLRTNKEKPVIVTVLRNKNEINLDSLIPKKERIMETDAMGIEGFEFRRGNIAEALTQAWNNTVTDVRMVYYSFMYLVQGKVSFKQMMGPVGIVTTIGNVVEYSESIKDKIVNLMDFTAMISINLGLFNLIPFPAMDGSKILILGVEGVRRKALPPEKEATISLVGLCLLMVLMIFATYNDILRAIGWG